MNTAKTQSAGEVAGQLIAKQVSEIDTLKAEIEHSMRELSETIALVRSTFSGVCSPDRASGGTSESEPAPLRSEISMWLEIQKQHLRGMKRSLDELMERSEL